MSGRQHLPLLTIKRIKEQSFFIDEILLSDPSKEIRIEIGRNFGFALNDNLVNLTLRIFYHYPESPHNILAEINVQNVFEVSNLNTFKISETEIILPKETIIKMVGESISHARSLLAKNLFGTVLQENLPGLIDPEEVASYFFPAMFQPETSELIRKI